MTAPLALDQIDELLRAWDERLRRMDENLVALDNEAIYQILAGKGGKRPILEGVTKERVTPAIDAVSELFENRERLGAVVAKAKEVRSSISTLTFWETDDKLVQIYKLLRGASIELGPSVVALSERSLLDVTYKDVLLEPEGLLVGMVKAFENARTVLLSVSKAWESLDPLITEIEQEMTSLRELALEVEPADTSATATSKDLAEFAAVEGDLSVLRSRVQRDPLGVGDGIGRGILPRIAALRAKFVAERAVQQRAKANLERARKLRQVLAQRHERALRADADVAREFVFPPNSFRPRPVDASLLIGLDDWLGKLEKAVDGRRWSSAEVGLARWLDAAEQYRSTEELAISQGEKSIALRSELEGRLSARRAQADALRARGLSFDPSLDQILRRAEQLLRTRPTPIAEAEAAVTSFEAAIVALGSRRQ